MYFFFFKKEHFMKHLLAHEMRKSGSHVIFMDEVLSVLSCCS